MPLKIDHVKKQLKSTYDAIASDFDRTRRTAWKDVEFFLEQFDEKQRSTLKLLDLGCGNGRHLKLAKSLGFQNLVGADFSRELIRIAKEKLPEAEFIISDVTNLKSLDSDSADIIIYIATLHHLLTEEERIRSLEECRKVLKENGKILVSCWSADNKKFESIKDKNNNGNIMWNNKYPRFYHLFENGELTKLLHKTNFKNIREWKSGNNFWATAEK